VLRSEFGFKKCLMYSDRLQSPNEEYKEVKKLFDLNIAETKQIAAGMIKTKWLLNVLQVQARTFVYDGDLIVVIPDSPFKRTKFFNLSNHARKLAEIDRAISIILVDGGRRNLDMKERDAFEQSCKEQSISCAPIVKLNMKGFSCLVYEGP
jgi:hypothetical protein